MTYHRPNNLIEFGYTVAALAMGAIALMAVGFAVGAALVLVSMEVAK